MIPTSAGKTILYGSQGPFSAAVFKGLIADGIPISHIFCAGVAPATQQNGGLPVAQPSRDEALDTLATQHKIPVDFISQKTDLQSVDQSLLKTVDYLLVACFPYRIPEVITRCPRIASLNLHPSLLPHYRGPDPIFWQLKKGEPKTGVSLHVLTEKFDAGPVIQQMPVIYAEGLYKKEIEELLGRAGARLFSTLNIHQLPVNEMSHRMQLQVQLQSQPQDEAQSSYYPMPTREDYELSAEWSAQQAFNFIRGSWPPLDQFRLTIENHSWIISQALDFSPEGKLAEKTVRKDDVLYIQFSPGILRAYGHKA